MLNLFRKEIQQGIKERAKLYIPQLPLTIEQTTTLCDLLKINHNNSKDEEFLLNLFINHIVPGVDETSYVKAQFLN